MHLTSEMPYRAKKDALKALLGVVSVPFDQFERVSWFLGEMHKHNDLRNSIAHHVWSLGARPGTIKPLALSVRSGKTTIKGNTDADPDYTEDELKSIANDLLKTYEAFKRYLLQIGFLPMRTGGES